MASFEHCHWLSHSLKYFFLWSWYGKWSLEKPDPEPEREDKVVAAPAASGTLPVKQQLLRRNLLLLLPLLDVELLVLLLEVAPPVDSRCAYGTSYWLPAMSMSLVMSYSVNNPESVVLRG